MLEAKTRITESMEQPQVTDTSKPFKRRPGRPRLRSELLIIPLSVKVGVRTFTILQLIQEYAERPYTEILRDEIDSLIRRHLKDKDFLRWLKKEGKELP